MSQNHNTTVKEQSREIKYDFLRAIGACAIIFVHSIPPQTNTHFQWWFHSITTPVLLSFVGLYFMLSGMFLLQSKIDGLLSYYKKRFISIVIPFFLYSCLYSCYDLVKNPQNSSMIHTLFSIITNFLNGTIPYGSHFWFMYTLVALYIFAPYLSKMVQNLSDRELMWLTWSIIVLQGLLTYGSMFGIYLPTPLFTGWTMYFMLGYALKRLYHFKYYFRFLTLGLLSLFITVVQKRLLPDFSTNIHDLAPTMVLIATCIFLTFEFYGDIHWKPLRKMINIAGRYSFSIYMIHFLILENLSKPLVVSTRLSQMYLPAIVSTFVITYLLSFLVAIIFDHTVVRFFLRPLQTR